MWPPLTDRFQTELAINTNVVVSDTHTIVSNVDHGVTNTQTIVSNIDHGVANTQAIVTDIHRIVAGQEGTDGKNRSVSATSTLFIAEPTLIIH